VQRPDTDRDVALAFLVLCYPIRQVRRENKRWIYRGGERARERDSCDISWSSSLLTYVSWISCVEDSRKAIDMEQYKNKA